jgi:hypothetical protein
MRDALAAWGAVEPAAPRPNPPTLPAVLGYVHTDDEWDAFRHAYYQPDVVAPTTYGDERRETRMAARCWVIVDRVSGLVLSVRFVERTDDEGPSLFQQERDRPKPRGRRGGKGQRGPSDYRELLRMLAEEGCTVVMANGSGHRLVTLPDGREIQISSTPSDYRTLTNEVARLRRMGLKLSKF